MMTYRFLALSLIVAGSASLTAQALTPTLATSCAQRAVDLQNQQVSLQKQIGARKAMVEETETAGDVWEEAETLRHFGKAAEADAAKLKYDSLKADLVILDTTVQSGVSTLNQQVEQYNRDCVPAEG